MKRNGGNALSRVDIFAQIGGILDDALKEAQVAFNTHISSLIDAGMELPPTLNLSELRLDPVS